MKQFAIRSRQKEILDDLDLPDRELAKNLEELGRVNRRLGGHNIVKRALRELLEHQSLGKPLKITDIGCGGGDTLRALYRSDLYKKYTLQLCGVDISNAAVTIAQDSSSQQPEIQYQTLDIFKIPPEFKSDIVLFNLVLHHFSDSQIRGILKRLKKHCRFIIINDLQRHPLPYFLFQGVSTLWKFSHISRHDGLLSIRKSFKKKEWHQLLQQAGVTHYRIRWRWAFRWIVMIDLQETALKNEH